MTKQTTGSQEKTASTGRKAQLMMGAKIAGGGVLVLAGSALIFPFLGAIMICGLGIGTVVVIGSFVHLYKVLKKNGLIQDVEIVLEKKSKESRAAEETPTGATPQQAGKLWDADGNVIVFQRKPNLRDIVCAKVGNELESGNITFAVENNTLVRRLNECEGTIQIRIISGQFSGKEGWVCKSVLVMQDLFAA